MRDALTVDIKGIKCDNASCDYNDESVKVEDYYTWLNKPCPKCGDNLLTEADYKGVQALIAFTSKLNGYVMKNMIPLNQEERVAATLGMNGSGEVEFKSIEIVKEETPD
ncbi:hypothetical protein ACK8P5_26510 (plasmid) [Paenibacillus sp. EC2-1]|uniref:hypothetical protein n=1 Tax=Paenibacillus sp. EC2-1 TaxID=3388665 RepID=UPI003BEF0E4C